MGQVFKLAEQYISTVDQDSVFVEIGSDRYEGSTVELAQLAIKYNTVLHTVDMLTEGQDRITQEGVIPGIIWHQGIGSEWAKNIFPTIGKKISCLYLDNFDYDWNVRDKNNPDIQAQKAQYLELGLEMNNQNCQVEHLKQTISLLPYMSEHSLVVCDDTYICNDCWIGKSGPAVVYLLAHGYRVIDLPPIPQASYGVILVRG